ncbi:5'-methylthioadenosine/S-adenosylhomocysteine nucleosidase [Candidatus Izimaplasma bacterium ZiA1]|uniref:5'-methylthioadenosine/adenosylhomocysteine nucleosidase n=1 Tax=Candidatus Izimoplasma sp. ZiA1 TaxID=2024899 RepID=UPI000BAA6871|nr:5'-methylthioadenosine/S-adenosylhomocysteine nucleosidase [Candidatus Izimaplasma bacterium ZiA1]
MIGIIGAMEVEIESIVKELQNKETINLKLRTVYKGTIDNKEVVVVLAGIGKVNAAITTSILIENFDLTSIFNIGVAGGVNGVNHKDVVVSEGVTHHDFDVTNFSDYVRGQVPSLPPVFKADENLITKTINALEKSHIEYKVGLIASGDQFVTKKETIKEVLALYPNLYAIEMEAAAIAQTAHLYNIPFIVYRSISDVLGDEAQHLDFNLFVKDASENAFKVIKEVINHL